MKTRNARLGIRPKSKAGQEAAEAAQERLSEIRVFQESPVWRDTVKMLRDEYLTLLLRCGPKDDLERFRLQTALNVIDKVEKHIEIAHSGAELDVAKIVRGDFVQRRATFWR